MHNTIHRKPATTPTCRDAAIQILGTSVNVVVNETFTKALEARILYAKGIVRAVIGDDEEADWMVSEAMGDAFDLGMEAYKSGRIMPAIFQDARMLKLEWETGYRVQGDFEEVCADNNEF